MSDYYSRTAAVHIDGTRIFQTRADQQAEEQIAELLERRWGCEIRSFGALAAVDWYASRAGRLVAVLELKTRRHASTQYPTVLLNVRKWLALALASVGLGCPAVVVIKLTDGVFWIPLSRIDASDTTIGGTLTIVKSRNDIEPIIKIPLTALRRVQEPT